MRTCGTSMERLYELMNGELLKELKDRADDPLGGVAIPQRRYRVPNAARPRNRTPNPFADGKRKPQGYWL
ncbi:MAG: hypothetical protein UZ07_CHB004003151, partial [Chlorobi bacterium OLB7]